MRLDKLLANSGLGSRKDVKMILKQGRVTVNHSITKNPKFHVHPNNDIIVVDGHDVQYAEFVYFMLNKPQGVISATQDLTQRTVLDLIADSDKVKQLSPVGRLDKDTEGLLLLTNDGQLSHDLLSPKKHVNKIYYVELAAPLTATRIEQLTTGVQLDGGETTRPAQIEILDAANRSVYITINEGKYHQVKRMFAAVDNRVTFLKRVSMGSLTLDLDLKPGEYRTLNQDELDKLLLLKEGYSD
ncbi:pseudouridine synthase [Tuberibacillus sp. Marseille-P3662]|uniref:pseudouridine synthase n=1 Tax=Tuberibacillus sp. Marseille-P3662 TaxID=1965358 RepID=UPI000A1C8F45|nr:pseudouridine synthase [Tuberibacillus sp. Marseille-P3662]